MKQVILLDKHGELATAASCAGWSGLVESWTDVQTVPLNPGTAIVSAANSLGFMDGGHDYVLSRVMFPGLEAEVKQAIATAGSTDLLGRPYLPIGRAIVVPTPGHPGVFVISAPTMLLPQDVQNTHNAYHATYAALSAARDDPRIDVVYIMGMCTGCGKMPAATAVRQMALALEDVTAARPARYSSDDIAHEQPRYYMNTEFIQFDPKTIIRA